MDNDSALDLVSSHSLKHDDNQDENTLPNLRLLSLVELIYVPLIFYVLTLWDKQDTWQESMGLILIFLLVQVEYISIKQTYKFYNVKLYISDCFSFIIYFSALNFLSNDDIFEIGYNPVFWILISFLWLGFAIWDFLMCTQENDQEKRRNFKKWGFKMFVFFLVGAICSFGLYYALKTPELTFRREILAITQVIPLILIIWSLIEWVQELGKYFQTESK